MAGRRSRRLRGDSPEITVDEANTKLAKGRRAKPAKTNRTGCTIQERDEGVESTQERNPDRHLEEPRAISQQPPEDVEATPAADVEAATVADVYATPVASVERARPKWSAVSNDEVKRGQFPRLKRCQKCSWR